VCHLITFEPLTGSSTYYTMFLIIKISFPYRPTVGNISEFVTGLRSFTPLTIAVGFVGKQESFSQGIGGVQTGFWGWGCRWVQTGW
jgi:hypothetical protein